MPVTGRGSVRYTLPQGKRVVTATQYGKTATGGRSGASNDVGG